MTTEKLVLAIDWAPPRPVRSFAWYHQSAQTVRQEHRRACLQRDRLAGHAYFDIVKELEGDARTAPSDLVAYPSPLPGLRSRILDNVEGVRAAPRPATALRQHRVLWNLTGINHGVHCTDVTNASRTMLMDIRMLQWREDVCEIFGNRVDAPRDQVLLRRSHG